MKRSRWGLVTAGVAVALLAMLVGRTMLSGPAFEARAEDKAAASKMSGDGTNDPRDPLPEGALVAGNGRVEPRGREVRVAANAAGRVAIVHVREGQRVKAGDVLVELETSAEAAALRSARAELDSARAELAKAKEGLRPEEVASLEAQADAALARAELAARDAGRAKQLLSQGAIAGDEADRAAREAEAADALRRSARAQADAAKAGSRSQDIAAARSRVQAASARAEEVSAHLERLRVLAPYDAEILQVKFRTSEFFDPRNGEPLLVLGDTSQLHVRMDVDERDVGKVRLGAAAFVTAEAFAGKRFRGKVIEIGRQMGRKNVRTDEPTERVDTRVLEVLVELESAKELVPGMRVTSYVEGGAGEMVVAGGK